MLKKTQLCQNDKPWRRILPVIFLMVFANNNILLLIACQESCEKNVSIIVLQNTSISIQNIPLPYTLWTPEFLLCRTTKAFPIQFHPETKMTQTPLSTGQYLTYTQKLMLGKFGKPWFKSHHQVLFWIVKKYWHRIFKYCKCLMEIVAQAVIRFRGQVLFHTIFNHHLKTDFYIHILSLILNLLDNLKYYSKK